MKKRLCFTLAIVVMLLIFGSLVKTSRSMRTGGIGEFNNFKHFDRKENLIHLFGYMFPDLSEDLAIVKEDQLIIWGFEWYHYTEEDLNNVLESARSTTVFTIDGVAVDDWFYTDIYFLENWDHDGDGPGDGDGDGRGDAVTAYHSAFRYSTILDVGEHTWYFEVYDPDGYWLIDSGTVIVLAED